MHLNPYAMEKFMLQKRPQSSLSGSAEKRVALLVVELIKII